MLLASIVCHLASAATKPIEISSWTDLETKIAAAPAINAARPHEGHMEYILPAKITDDFGCCVKQIHIKRKYITIHGAGAVLDAKGGHERFFDVSDGATLNLVGPMAFENLNEDRETKGGAISMMGGSTLIANDIAFRTHTAVSGGAITLGMHTTATFTRCTFESSCRKTKQSLDAKKGRCLGGSIFGITGATLLLNNSTFTHNVGDLGGAIYLGSLSRSVIKGCTFEDNAAKYYTKGFHQSQGGAIRLFRANLHIADCLFKGNSASTGGAIYSQDSKVVVASSSFESNTASSKGGALNVLMGHMTVRTTGFKGNTATQGKEAYQKNADEFVFEMCFAAPAPHEDQYDKEEMQGCCTVPPKYSGLGLSGSSAGASAGIKCTASPTAVPTPAPTNKSPCCNAPECAITHAELCPMEYAIAKEVQAKLAAEAAEEAKWNKEQAAKKAAWEKAHPDKVQAEEEQEKKHTEEVKQQIIKEVTEKVHAEFAAGGGKRPNPTTPTAPPGLSPPTGSSPASASSGAGKPAGGKPAGGKAASNINIAVPKGGSAAPVGGAIPAPGTAAAGDKKSGLAAGTKTTTAAAAVAVAPAPASAASASASESSSAWAAHHVAAVAAAVAGVVLLGVCLTQRRSSVAADTGFPRPKDMEQGSRAEPYSDSGRDRDEHLGGGGEMDSDTSDDFDMRALPATDETTAGLDEQGLHDLDEVEDLNDLDEIEVEVEEQAEFN